jgi:diguanylate cyclase (GGDEF)-like protein/PAS domain S-box-containing protein
MMHRIYTCLMQQHDIRLIVIAGVICLLASWTALNLARLSMKDRPRARLAWLAVATTVTGCGIWATHFLAMLAFAPGLPVGYDPALTALSVLVAIAVTGAGFAITLNGGVARLWLGGAVIGMAIGAMHYTGMAALRAPALVHWDAGLVAMSLLLGAGLSAAALRTGLHGAKSFRVPAGALLLAGAICALHLTGMGALQLEPTPFVAVPEHPLSSWWLAFGVIGATVIILGSATGGMIVDQHLADRTAREATRLRTLVEATFEGLLIHADGTILDLNESLARMLSRGRDELIGHPLLDTFAPDWVDEVDAHLAALAPMAAEAELVRADGGRVPVEILGRPIDYRGRQAYVVAMRDISERRRAEERIRHLAHHDPLTGLPNRILFRDRLEQALARAGRSLEKVAVLCLDLDRFKEVNDVHGHAVGDALLRQVASRLQAGLRKGDTVARLGGDEFAIIQVGLAGPGQAARLAERVISSVTDGCELDGTGAEIGISAGIAIYPNDGLDPDTLVRKADTALYRAKAEGRGTCQMFEPGMETKLQTRRILERELRAAISGGGLAVHYQPQAAVTTGRIIGFEALARWPHPDRGLVAPSEFIPLAEETGLIRPLGEWILRTACREATRWPSHLRLGVNLSPAQFRADLPQLIADILEEAELPPERLELEITEGVLIRDVESALDILCELKALGVQVAMDDFGTGYSSLGYLQRFRFDRIKMDRSFVAGLLTRREAAPIVRAIVGLSTSLGMSVIAEGVETEQQLAALRREGCEEVQGYLIGRPMPAGDVLALLAGGARAVTRPSSKADASGPWPTSLEFA